MESLLSVSDRMGLTEIWLFLQSIAQQMSIAPATELPTAPNPIISLDLL